MVNANRILTAVIMKVSCNYVALFKYLQYISEYMFKIQFPEYVKLPLIVCYWSVMK